MAEGKYKELEAREQSSLALKKRFAKLATLFSNIAQTAYLVIDGVLNGRTLSHSP